MIDYSSYNELKKSQGYIEDEDFKVFVINNVLTQDNIKYIYDNINKSEETMQSWGGRKSLSIKSSEALYLNLNAVMTMNMKQKMELKEFFFVRYSKEYGFESKLFPHYDNREAQRITLDIQLNATEDWGVVVEGETNILSFNQGLVFAGTQQIHWRENKKISDDAVIDMLICNFAHDPEKPLQEGQVEKLIERSNLLIEVTGIGNKDEKIVY